MRKIVLAILLSSAPLLAQLPAPGPSPVTSAPSGSCRVGARDQIVVSTGDHWFCGGISGGTGTWAKMTGGGGSAPGGAHFNLQFNNGSGGFGGDSAINTDGSGHLTVSSLNNVIQANTQTGADACAKITTALAALPSTGGTVDARGFQGVQTCAGGITISVPANIELGFTTLQLSSPLIVGSQGVTIGGSGWQTEQPGSNATVIQASSTFTGSQLIQVGSNGNVVHTVIKNLQVDCNSKSTNGIGIVPGTGVSIYGKIDSTSIINCVDGISAIGGNTFDWTVISSRIVTNTVGVNIQSNAWRFVSDEVDNNTTDGYHIDNTFVLAILGGDIESNGTNNIHLTNSAGNTSGLTVQGVYFEPASTTVRDIKFDNTGSNLFLGIDIGGNRFAGASIESYAIDIPSSLAVEGLNLHGNNFNGYLTDAINNQGGCISCWASGNYAFPNLLNSTAGWDMVDPQSNGTIFNHAMSINNVATFSTNPVMPGINVPAASNFPVFLDSQSYSFNLIPNQTATSSNNYGSPGLELRGSVWNGTSAIQDNWVGENLVGTGVNPNSTLNFIHSGSSGFAAAEFPNIIDSGVTGSTQCLHVNSSGLMSGTGSDCAPALGNTTNETANFSPVCSGAYAAQAASSITATLPASPATGCVLSIYGEGAGGYTVTAGSSIIFQGSTTTVTSFTQSQGQTVALTWDGTDWHATKPVTGGGGGLCPSVNNQTGTSYTLVVGDGTTGGNACIGTLTMNNAASNTVTVPPNSSVNFPVPDQIDVIQLGAGQTCLVASAGVTINTGTSLCVRAQNTEITIRQIATNTWQVMDGMPQ